MITDAEWIQCGRDCESPLIRRKFTLTAPVSGSIDITGLGYFELRCNGARVSEDRLVPALSDYEERRFRDLSYPISDTFSHRIYYLHYDLTPLLRAGENELEIFLGNGWYRQNERVAEGHVSFGDSLKALYSAELREKDGTVFTLLSNGSETFEPTEVVFSNLFLGETQDARLAGKPEKAEPVRVVPAPKSRLMLQQCPPDRVVRTIVPKLIFAADGKKIYDAGENVSGWARVRARGKSGDIISLRFSEELTPSGEPDFESSGGCCTCESGRKQIQSDTFICSGEPFVFEPKFVFHTFRYIEVTGETEEITVAVVHADVPVTSAFSTGNEALDWLYDAYLRTQLDNMHGGVPSDCPHRERLGYTGDGQACAPAAMLLLGSREFYRKWIGDIMDCQDVSGGHVQHTAPFMGGGGGPCGWGGAVVFVPYQYYRYFGDRNHVRECYPHMKKWTEYISRHSEDGLVVREEEEGWCLGDWASLGKMELPEPFVNTCYFLRALRELAEMAELLALPGDAAAFRQEVSDAQSALLRHYYSRGTGSFCGGIQGADAFALDAGLTADSRTLENLKKRYSELGWLDTGMFGTDILVDVLFRFGCEDLAFRLLTNDRPGGYLFMKRSGATTVWEYFGGRNSHCHPMFGAPVRSLFTHLLGIRQPEGSAGFASAKISPCFPEGLDRAFGSVLTVAGRFTVSWSRKGGNVRVTAEVPEKTETVFRYESREEKLHPGINCITVNLKGETP